MNGQDVEGGLVSGSVVVLSLIWIWTVSYTMIEIWYHKVMLSYASFTISFIFCRQHYLMWSMQCSQKANNHKWWQKLNNHNRSFSWLIINDDRKDPQVMTQVASQMSNVSASQPDALFNEEKAWCRKALTRASLFHCPWTDLDKYLSEGSLSVFYIVWMAIHASPLFWKVPSDHPPLAFTSHPATRPCIGDSRQVEGGLTCTSFLPLDQPPPVCISNEPPTDNPGERVQLSARGFPRLAALAQCRCALLSTGCHSQNLRHMTDELSVDPPTIHKYSSTTMSWGPFLLHNRQGFGIKWHKLEGGPLYAGLLAVRTSHVGSTAQPSL